MNMNMRFFISILSVVVFSTLFVGVKSILAIVELPTLTTFCETKNGSLIAVGDGFSVFSSCKSNQREVKLVGEKGELGPQGIPGEKGDPGEVDPKIYEDISTLSQKIEELEQIVAPLSKTITIFNDAPIPQLSEWINVADYTNITFLSNTNVSSSQIVIQITNDLSSVTDTSGFTEYYWSSCSNSSCPPINLPIIANYYRYKVTSFNSGNINASAYLSR
jgi:hypothetical protein